MNMDPLEYSTEEPTEVEEYSEVVGDEEIPDYDDMDDHDLY